MFRRIVAFLALGVLVGCGSGDRTPPPAASAPQPSVPRQAASADTMVAPPAAAPETTTAPTTGSFADEVRSEITGWSPATTPAEWRAAHRDDSLTSVASMAFGEDSYDWCMRATGHMHADSDRVAIRYAYFYAPPAPPPPIDSASLPRDTSVDLVATGCRLGLVWIGLSSADTLHGLALADTLRGGFTARYGAAAPQPNTLDAGPVYFGSAYWRVFGMWRHDSTTVVSAFDRSGGGRVLAFAFVPFSHFGRDGDDLWGGVGYSIPDTVGRAALRMTGWPSESTAALRALADTNWRDTARPGRIRTWVERARALSPARRTAALIALDRVVPTGLARSDSALAKRYQDMLGARFVSLAPMEDGLAYAHSLLDSAVHVAPESPAGVLGRLMLLRSGFDPATHCGLGPMGDSLVIATGDSILRASPAPSVEGEVNVLEGDAYADIVAYAAGVVEDWVDSAAYVPHAAEARRMAITHYARALAVDPTPDRAAVAWRRAWWLLAGLPPTTPRFLCMSD